MCKIVGIVRVLPPSGNADFMASRTALLKRARCEYIKENKGKYHHARWGKRKENCVYIAPRVSLLKTSRILFRFPMAIEDCLFICAVLPAYPTPPGDGPRPRRTQSADE